MFPHWHYLLERPVRPGHGACTRGRRRTCRGAGTRPGAPYDVTADDAAYAVLELDGGVVASVNSSWAVRVNRRELLELQVDGTHGSAVAGLRHCAVQHRAADADAGLEPGSARPRSTTSAQWTDVPDNAEFDNGFKVQWELFLRAVGRGHAAAVGPGRGAKGVQLAELALRSSARGPPGRRAAELAERA